MSRLVRNNCPPPSSFDETVSSLVEAIRWHAHYSLGKVWHEISQREILRAVALTLRDRMLDKMFATTARYRRADAKQLYYLSIEFLLGRSLGTNLHNLGLLEASQDALIKLGVDLEELQESERDPALGNGGLGRLAACFLDSLATLDMPGYGYGINYDYGLFRQEIDNGYQKEKPDYWAVQGAVWQIERNDEACAIPVYGRLESVSSPHGRSVPTWVDQKIVVGVPYDMPIVGYGGRTVNYLRLYSARASDEFDMQIFQGGDYLQAMQQKIASETISRVLYPSDSVDVGRELRLLQEYFLVACAMRDIIKRYLKDHTTLAHFPTKVAVQLNDTHPALAVAELMRALMDDHALGWENAWEITQATLGYTNHTLLPEALEKWPVSLMERVLPRHLHIIYEINQHFLEHVRTVWPGDLERVRRMSLIEEGPQKQVRMAHLAMVGSHSINGVSALHSHLLRTSLMADFAELWPHKFNNKTNGMTPRRWLLKANPALAHLLQQTIGTGWITDLDKLRGLEVYAHEAGFQRLFGQAKLTNKERLAKVIDDLTHTRVDPHSLFDVHVKRIHEYKRQLLKVMHIIHTYLQLVEDGQPPCVPRTYVFAGKAAPGYWAAKQMIKLINNVSQVINQDPRADAYMKVVFLPDYRVSLAECIIPAADLSEQISTAGMEASGTGNMKFAVNGALTMGTLDGANIEILEEVGADNIFIFGLKAEEIQALRQQGSYVPAEYCERYPAVQRIVEALRSNRFCPHEPGLFTWISDALLNGGDPYMYLADLPSYLAAQQQADTEFIQASVWVRKTILNVARMGKFSSDRTIREYARDIWHITSVL